MSDERNLFDDFEPQNTAETDPLAEFTPRESRFKKFVPERLDYLVDRTRDKDDVVPGITRRQARNVTIFLSLFTMIVCGVLFAITATIWGQREIRLAEVRGEEAAVTATQSAIETQVAQAIFNETATVVAFFELNTATPTPSSTPDLPPTFTPSPTDEGVPAQYFPSVPPELDGVIYAWGGNNPESREFLPVRLYTVEPETTFTSLDQRAGKDVSANQANSRLVFVRFIRGEEVEQTLLLKNPSDPEDVGTELNTRFEALGVTTFTDPRLSHTGEYLVFAGESTATETQSLYYYDIQNNAAYRLTNTPGVTYKAPAISPDGSRVFAVRQSDVDGTDLISLRLDALDRTLTTGEQLVEEEIIFPSDTTIEDSPRWSPDGTRLVFTRAPIDQPENNDLFMITFGADGGIVGTLAIPISSDPADEREPVFSPDGSHIVYSANPGGNYNLFVINVNSREKYQLTVQDSNVFAGTWAPAP